MDPPTFTLALYTHRPMLRAPELSNNDPAALHAVLRPVGESATYVSLTSSRCLPDVLGGYLSTGILVFPVALFPPSFISSSSLFYFQNRTTYVRWPHAVSGSFHLSAYISQSQIP